MSWSDFTLYIGELNTLSMVLRLTLAATFGAFLGIDRARKNRPAGSRTHMLVCMGAALVMITGEFLLEKYGSVDPSRLGAQVISGIGFLGAGTIILTSRNQVMGLTTAAGLWVDACIGLAIGAGFYSAAIFSGILILFIVIVMHGIDDSLQSRSRHMQVFAEFQSPGDLSRMLSYAANNGISINSVEIVQARNSQEDLAAIIQLKLSERIEHQIVLEALGKVEGILFVSKV